MGECAPFWRFSAASYPDLGEARLDDALLGTKSKAVIGEDTSAGVCTSLSYQLLFSSRRFCMFFSLFYEHEQHCVGC